MKNKKYENQNLNLFNFSILRISQILEIRTEDVLFLINMLHCALLNKHADKLNKGINVKYNY